VIRRLCKKFKIKAQILILKIQAVFLRLKFSPSLNLTKNPDFRHLISVKGTNIEFNVESTCHFGFYYVESVRLF